MGVMDEIIGKKKERLEQARSREPVADLKARIGDAVGPRDFGGAISRRLKDGSLSPRISLIAEVKRASPSRGLIRAEFRPDEIARAYDPRARALSVITEEDFFEGRLSYIPEVKAATERPVLRKDFIIHEYQIFESRAAGADAILLIEAALGITQAAEYMQMAGEMGMAVLLEVHDQRGLERALSAGAAIIGINNRDLGTLHVDLETTFRLLNEIPPGKTVVSESGIRRREDVLRLEAAGLDAVLIGTALMEAPDIGARIEELMGEGE
jgi:indole-3-glycerol phosphate synthase